MSWFKNLLPKISENEKKGVPEGVWDKCTACQAILYKIELEKNLNVCTKCGHHMRLSARKRLEQFFNGDDNVIELGADIVACDKLKFRDTKKYKDRLSASIKSSLETEAIIAMSGKLFDIEVIACAFEFNFIGGSMGAAVGEKFVIACLKAIENNIPFVCFSTSGGARMQEGLFSLFQMAKTSAVIARLDAAGLPFISVLLDPTMGGVSASFAMLGDIIIAEPRALIGFSGPRVIEQTIRQKLPNGFQRSEFLLEHGAIDLIVDRREMRQVIYSILLSLMFYR